MKPLRGTRHYTFEIATRTPDGRWAVGAAQSGVFTRTAKATARSIAERWIIERRGQLGGGRLVILGEHDEPPRTFDSAVRIVIRDPGTGRRLAAAHIGTDRELGSRKSRLGEWWASAVAGHQQPADLDVR